MDFYQEDVTLRKAEELRDEILLEDSEHHEFCPTARARDYPTTLCLCHELKKADRAAVTEDRADDERKYGGL